MDASRLTNGSGTVSPAKSNQPNAVRSDAKKVSKRAIGKKATTERPQLKTIGSSKSEKLVCRYCGSDDLTPASSSVAIADVASVSASAMDRRHGRRRRSSRSRFGQIDERGRARKRARPLSISERLFLPFRRHLLRTTREDSSFRFSTDSVCYWDRRRVVSPPL